MQEDFPLIKWVSDVKYSRLKARMEAMYHNEVKLSEVAQKMNIVYEQNKERKDNQVNFGLYQCS